MNPAVAIAGLIATAAACVIAALVHRTRITPDHDQPTHPEGDQP